jgi:hypothetical protein
MGSPKKRIRSSVVDPDSTYHHDTDPDADPVFRFFLFKRIRIRLFTLMRIRIQILASNKGSNSGKIAIIGSYSIHFGLTSANDADPDVVPDPV